MGTIAMHANVSKAIKSLGHNLELYATVAVCTLLLIMKLLHIVDEHWVQSAILVTLLLITIGSLRDRSYENELRQRVEDIALSAGKDLGLRWYTHRSEATADMLADIDSFKHLVFVGVSHRQLSAYLLERLQAPRFSALPWESIEIYFASRVVGEAYEGTLFSGNLLTARLNLACLLTDPQHAERIPHLRRVAFFQQASVSTHTGSLFGASDKEIQVIYAVHSTVFLHGDTHQGLTMRLSVHQGSKKADVRFDYYERAYRTMQQSSDRLGAFSRSVWDISARPWLEYARSSEVLSGSARHLAGMLKPASGDLVLEVGAGCGETAQAILDAHPGVSMMLLDGSPQMIKVLRDRFGGTSRVHLALCRLPPIDKCAIDVNEARFKCIVIHQSLGDLLQAFGGFDELASWIRSSLQPDGEILITAHNTLMQIEPPEGFAAWADPLRAEIIRRLKKSGRPTHQVAAKFQKEDLLNAFQRHGFKLLAEQQQTFEVTYEERRRLWHIPAVIKSICDEIESTQHHVIVDEAVDALRGARTMPRTVVYLHFRVGK